MKISKGMLLLTVMIGLLFGACAEEENPYPEEPASATGLTDAGGQALLNFGSHEITVTAIDIMDQPVAEITIMGHLFKDYLYLFAVGNDSWYSNHKLVPYSDMGSSGGTIYEPKPAFPMTIEADIEIILQSVTREVYSYPEDPLYQTDLFSDEWADILTFEGSLADIYEVADSIAKEDNIIIAMGDELAADVNAPVQTISMIIDSFTVANAAVFSVLVGLDFHLFDADTLTYSYIEYGDSILPFILINEAALVEGGFFCQFTLTWGEEPQDLDSHLWTPVIDGFPYHVYYGNPGEVSEVPYCFLNVDDVTGWGPEHIVIYQTFPGTYYYSVHHYAGNSSIPASGAVVSLLKPDRSVEQFAPPDQADTGEGWYWHVCSVDGETGAVTEIGTMTQLPPVTAASSSPLPPKVY